MFGSKKQTKNVGATDTFIGEGTIIEGDLTTNASLRIEGTVIGDIDCAGDITIGEKGSVRSILSARNILNAGIIVGTVHAKGKLTITKTGRVEGRIQTKVLHISEGGVFKGECSMDLPKGSELGASKERDQKDLKGKDKDREKNTNGKQATA